MPSFGKDKSVIELQLDTCTIKILLMSGDSNAEGFTRSSNTCIEYNFRKWFHWLIFVIEKQTLDYNFDWKKIIDVIQKILFNILFP